MNMLHVILLPVLFRCFCFLLVSEGYECALYTLNDLQMTIHCFETNLDRASFSWANNFMTVHCSYVQHHEKNTPEMLNPPQQVQELVITSGPIIRQIMRITIPVLHLDRTTFFSTNILS